jgi:hypothetical protein
MAFVTLLAAVYLYARETETETETELAEAA